MTLSPEPDNYSIPEFRTYVESVAEQTVVRLSEMGELYVSWEDILREPVDNSPAESSIAEDRGDTPLFDGLLGRRLRAQHERRKTVCIRRRSAG